MSGKNLTKTSTLYYIHDPMCSWCYAFKPVFQQVQQQLPDQIELTSLLGGLAGDTDEPMPIELQRQLEATWQRIEQKVPDIQFNYDFWKNCNPRRTTFPACRAVIAAQTFDAKQSYSQLMIEAIQRAYYQQARNPSDNTTLIELAKLIGLDEVLFQTRLHSNNTQLELERQINLSHQLNVNSYPSLVLKISEAYWPVSIDYISPEPILEKITMLLEFE